MDARRIVSLEEDRSQRAIRCTAHFIERVLALKRLPDQGKPLCLPDHFSTRICSHDLDVQKAGHTHERLREFKGRYWRHLLSLTASWGHQNFAH